MVKLDTHAIRVAVFTDNDFGKTNGVTTTWRAVLARADASQRVRIYTASDADVEQPDYLSVASFGAGLPWYREMRIYLPAVRRFMRQVASDGITVVHVATPGPVGLAGRWIARRAGLPLVGSYHTELGEYARLLSGSARLGRTLDGYMRWFYDPCASLLVPSYATARQLRSQGYRGEQLRVWPRGVDVERFSPERRSTALRRAWGVDDRRPVILYAGRLSAEKGLDLAARIQQCLHRRAVAHRFVFAGDGPMRADLQRRLPDAVFMGSLPHAQVAEVMASADVFLFPSATDTFGNVVLEAQASGIPVVVSDRGGPCQQMRPGVTGEVCRADDAESFAVALARLLRDRDWRTRMGNAARQLARDRPWDQALRPLFDAWDDASRLSAGTTPAATSPSTTGVVETRRAS